jgi:hypothetical protein
MQALERRYPDLPMVAGAPVKREFEYIRHGTLALMGGRALPFLHARAIRHGSVVDRRRRRRPRLSGPSGG